MTEQLPRWYKRYLDEEEWIQIRKDRAVFELTKAFPYDIERILHDIEVGRMSFVTKYVEYAIDVIDMDGREDNVR